MLDGYTYIRTPYKSNTHKHVYISQTSSLNCMYMCVHEKQATSTLVVQPIISSSSMIFSIPVQPQLYFSRGLYQGTQGRSFSLSTILGRQIPLGRDRDPRRRSVEPEVSVYIYVYVLMYVICILISSHSNIAVYFCIFTHEYV